MTDATATTPEAHEKEFEIVVNAEQHDVESQTVTFEEVVELADPNPPSPETRFTVTFRHAKEPKEGSLRRGGSVEVKKEGTIFNVKATTKS